MNYDIIICDDSTKRRILSNYPLIKRPKFYTDNQFINAFLFKVPDTASIELFTKLNIEPELIDMQLNALHHYKFYAKNEPIKQLKEIYKLLEDRFEYNERFKLFLKNKKIGVYSNSSFLDRLLEGYNVEYIEENNVINSYKQEFNSIDEEVDAVLNKVGELIYNGTSLNSISIMTASNRYLPILLRKSQLLNIPIHINKKKSVYSYPTGKKLIRSILKTTGNISENVNYIINQHIEKYPKISDIDYKIIEKISTYFNKYSDSKYEIEELKDLILYELQKIKVEPAQTKECLILNDESKPNQFVLGFDEESFISIIRSEGFFSREDKLLLNIDDALNRNKRNKENVLSVLQSFETIYFSYSKQHQGNRFHLNKLIKNFECKAWFKPIETYSYENIVLNKAVATDKLRRIGVQTDYLNVDVPIHDAYDPQYELIESNYLNEYLESDFHLSYSSMNLYNQCQYKFFLTKVVGISHYEENLGATIGNLYHEVLEDTNIHHQEKINEFSNNYNDLIDKFYINLQNENLDQVLRILKEQDEQSDFEVFSLEANYKVAIDDVEFTGFIDKVLVNKKTNEYVVIDYKTGGFRLDLKHVKFGLDSQVLTYKLLLEEVIGDGNCIGFFYQSLMPITPFKYQEDKNLDKQYEDLMKLKGYIIDSHASIYALDHEYKTNTYIDKLRVKKDDSFYSTSKVLSSAQQQSLKDLLLEQIKETIANIRNKQFYINPKSIDNKSTELTSCGYCEFKDICYKKPQHTVYLSTKEETQDENETSK